jgi:biotin carboxylase
MPTHVAAQDFAATPPASEVQWFVVVEVLLRPGAARPEFGVGERLDAPGVALLEAARSRGLATAVLAADRACYGEELDWLVDRWIECDTGDAAAIVAAARALEGRVAAVTSSVDGLAGAAAAAARTLGLRGATPGAPVLADDRRTLHRALAAAGLAGVAWGEVPATTARPGSPLGYPCVVQPVDGAAGWDVALVSDDRELQQLAARHLARNSYGRGPRPAYRLVAEEYVPGPRHGADGFVGDGGPLVLAWSEGVTTPPPHVADLVRTWTTRPPTPEAAGWVRSWLAAAGPDFGPFHLEFVLGPAGPRLVVLTPTLARDGAHTCVDLVSGVDTADLVVARLLGEPDVARRRPAAAGASTLMRLDSQVAGRVRSVSGVRGVAGIPGLVVAEVFADVGSRSDPADCGRHRLGHVLTVGQTPEQSQRRAAAALDGIQVAIDELELLPSAQAPNAGPRGSGAWSSVAAPRRRLDPRSR